MKKNNMNMKIITTINHNHNKSSMIMMNNYSPITPTTPQMDPNIWSKLPPEILEYILSFLPLKTFLNLRSTCKSFWSLIFSPSFISKHSSSSSPSSSSSSSSPFSSFLLLSHPQFHRHFPLYDCTIGTWRNISLSLSDSLHYSSPPFTNLVSSGGLFCLHDPNSCSMLVFNLLAKSSRKIDYPSFNLHLEHLTFVKTPNGYAIFALFSDFGSSSKSRAFVFDSKVLTWRIFEGFSNLGVNLGDTNRQQGVFYEGGLYFSTPEPFSIVRFDLGNGNWVRPIGVLPNNVTFLRLVSNGDGKLFMVGGVGNNGISRSIKLWEMDENNENNWVEIQSLPDLMCRKFVSVCYHNYEHVYCFWHEGMICICCYTWSEILYYLVSRRTWHWIPKCPSLPVKCSCGFKWFSFVPNLYAEV